MDILEQSWKTGSPIRAITLTAQNLVPEDEAAEQLGFFQSYAFQQQHDRTEKLERTMDAIRSKYGREAISTAALAPEQDHEAGVELP